MEEDITRVSLQPAYASGPPSTESMPNVSRSVSTQKSCPPAEAEGREQKGLEGRTPQLTGKYAQPAV